jgi:hypothetical protein
MSATAKRAAELIWQKYERRIGQEPVPSDGVRPGTAGGLDKDSFILNVTAIIDDTISHAVNQTLGDALNSGDGVYRP